MSGSVGDGAVERKMTAKYGNRGLRFKRKWRRDLPLPRTFDRIAETAKGGMPDRFNMNAAAGQKFASRV